MIYTILWNKSPICNFFYLFIFFARNIRRQINVDRALGLGINKTSKTRFIFFLCKPYLANPFWASLSEWNFSGGPAPPRKTRPIAIGGDERSNVYLRRHAGTRIYTRTLGFRWGRRTVRPRPFPGDYITMHSRILNLNRLKTFTRRPSEH